MGGEYVNYDCFAQLEAGTLAPAEAETEQAFMERVLKAVFNEHGDSCEIIDRLEPAFAGCNAAEKTVDIDFTVYDWMLNPNGTLHGGMMSTVVDIAFSLIARYYAKKRVTVTVQLSVNFLRIIKNGEKFTVHVQADHVGRRSIVAHASVTAESSPKPAATASAVLM